MGYATDAPVGLNEFYSANMPSSMEHWYSNAQAEVQLPEPARTVYIEYEGQPAVNEGRIYAHVLNDNPTPPSTVRITHNWTESGVEKSFSTTSDNGTRYIIDAGEQPNDISIQLAVASELFGSPITSPEQATIPSQPTAPADSSEPLNGGNSGNSGGGVFGLSWFLVLYIAVFSKSSTCTTGKHNQLSCTAARQGFVAKM